VVRSRCKTDFVELTIASLAIGLISVVLPAWVAVEVEGVVEVAVLCGGNCAFVA